jgi:uncharacterized alkaline shock family protein YloU
MKIFKEFLLVIFSICMLGLAIIVILTSLQVLDVKDELNSIITYVINNRILIMGTSLIVSLLSLVGIFAASDKDEDVKAGLAIKHETGTVYITKDTFESIVLNVARSYATLKNIKVSVNISEEGAIVTVYTYIMPDTVVPTLTSKLQENIKDAVLKQTTVEIKEVNIKIKGVYSQLEKKA